MFATLFRLMFWGGILYVVLPLDHSELEKQAALTAQKLTDEATQLCARNPETCLNGAGQTAKAMEQIGRTLGGK